MILRDLMYVFSPQIQMMVSLSSVYIHSECSYNHLTYRYLVLLVFRISLEMQLYDSFFTN